LPFTGPELGLVALMFKQPAGLDAIAGSLQPHAPFQK
jgi:hypothetical protein